MTSKTMYEYENKLIKEGVKYIGGIDEAGRGPLAGPVVAACVVLRPDSIFKYVDDSKKLSPKLRNLALQEIKENALAIGIGIVSHEEIDRVNILRATKLAMMSAVDNLNIKPECLLIDATAIDTDIPQFSIIKGDQKSVSIAAASIVAKVTRDLYMTEMDKVFPEYNFKKNKGYGTKEHLQAITEHGITKIHRKTFEPIKTIINNS